MTTDKKLPVRGRPTLPDAERRTEVIRLRTTKAERKNYDEKGGDVWLRRELNRKPRK